MAKAKPQLAPEDIITIEVREVLDLQDQLAERTTEMMSNPKFREFLEWQKDTETKIGLFWKMIETAMIEQKVKRIPENGTAEWGSLTIVDNTYFDIDEKVLPDEFKKLQPDKAKIRTAYVLTGTAPDGVKVEPKQHLMKRIKGIEK